MSALSRSGHSMATSQAKLTGRFRPEAAVQSVANQQNQRATIGRKDLALVGQFLIQELATYSG